MSLYLQSLKVTPTIEVTYYYIMVKIPKASNKCHMIMLTFLVKVVNLSQDRFDSLIQQQKHYVNITTESVFLEPQPHLTHLIVTNIC
jgi:hypothetical protein